MNNSAKRLTALFLLSGFIALLGTGCQTTKGFGRDVEHVGDKIQGK